jgi:predicted cobalt transporter CbtA
MQIVLGGTRPSWAAVLAFGLIFAGPCLAQDPAPESFISPTPDKQCDEFNRSWKVTNQHTYLSIKVVVRWNAVGAKEMQEEFILPPGTTRALGCGAELKIVSAQIMQF